MIDVIETPEPAWLMDWSILTSKSFQYRSASGRKRKTRLKDVASFAGLLTN